MDSTTECIIYLLALASPVQDFTTALAELPEEQRPVLTTEAVRWIFPPTAFSVHELTTTHWDITACFKAPGPFSIHPNLSKLIKSSWSISFAVPSALLASLATTQSELAASNWPRSRELDLLTDSDLRKSDTISSVDSAEVTSGLKTWMESFSKDQEEKQHSQDIIMFNLLAFKDMAKYRKYQDAFVAGVGVRHGVRPLLYGEVINSSLQNQGKSPWEMVALVYYPSPLHFGDMLSSPDYKEISHKYRDGSLVDNPILCLSNI
ncbi:hypothetical protein TMatcc_008373 [Talaromyces marneffei ATCC 18224]|uniref:DUF1330 domain-containing protein n=2 Tax=Talaromyces marneffei TaxID=37727 RepID=B6QM66_TALMQ|nr:uncharacterized protein EYB26_007718 [Talaromyces marneffei]EEA22193.1 conserved hypothetical protein [Talaromyces marneffei ATCC 18224]KAE8550352.1 hypothetical protein EYB25_006578 [Talaromyces marneffei]QGA20018.1 hypothetical protein EYB26_007718 [Talaromyces marneffei]